MLRESVLTLNNVSMIFRLNRNSVYMLSDGENEIILSNDNGVFVVDPTKKYIVSGDAIDALSPTAQNPAQNPQSQLGIPLSYQQPNIQRGRLNPPPAGQPSLTLKRPKFTRSASRWKKSVILVEIDGNGTITEKFQIHLVLDENSSTVQTVSDKLQDQIGHEVTVLDSKFLPIVSCEMTKGMCILLSIISMFSNI